MSESNADNLQLEASITDLGPLSWVFDELRKSLDAANKALKRFVRENEKSRLDSLEAVDPTPLRLAAQQLHQAVGALEMVGFAGPAQLLRGMEAAVQRFVSRPHLCTEESAHKVERAGFALVEYLEGVLGQKTLQPVALFAQYREVRELVAAERVHPADLWPFDQRGMEVVAPGNVKQMQPEARLRSQLDGLVLQVVKQDTAAAAKLARVCGALSAGSDSARVCTFWRVAAAFFEALSLDVLGNDVFVKRTASRMLLQYVSLAQGNAQVSETLLHELLFFCAQAQPQAGVRNRHLSAVREAFGLDQFPAVDYQMAILGRYDPAVLALARTRITAAKELWSLFSGGDVGRGRQVVDQFRLVGESLNKLHASSVVLSQALIKAVEQASREALGVRAELAMEVATTTLYLEAAFEDFDPNDPLLGERIHALADRLEHVLSGAPAQPLDAWMEQLYRRVSDRQTMGSVVGELKGSLDEVEKQLDLFFRTPQEKGGLHIAASQLAQMRGVLSVLGLEPAVQTVARMRTTVDEILEGLVDDTEASHHLGHNLSALSLLVDMLNYQPALAKKLFVFDKDKGELQPLMGRSVLPEPSELADAQDLPRIEPEDLLQAGTVPPEALQALEARALPATLTEPVAADEPVPDAFTPVPMDGLAVVVEEGGEDELLDIFLEEAREVVTNGLAALRGLRDNPGDLALLTTLRRAYHTLKGSSRMVGLSEFGEAAWAMEQVFNTELAEQRLAAPDLLTLAQETLIALSHWVDDIERRCDVHWQAVPFRVSAEAWRQQLLYRPLVLQGIEVPEPVQAIAQGEPVEADAAQEHVAVANEALVPLPTEAPLAVLEPVVDEAAQLPEQAIEPQQSPEPVAMEWPEPEPNEALDAEGESLELSDADVTQVIEINEPETPLDEPVAPAEFVAATPVLEPAHVPEPLPEEWPADDLPEDQVKLIGPLRIGIKLYNVFLNEADEWSRRLCTGLAEWALERHEPVHEHAEGLAHSLAGSSATVGFQPLSDIARALEHAIGAVRMHQQAGQAASAEQAQLFVNASEDIRRLLHQFAAGFYKEPQPDLLAALQRVAHEPLSLPDEAPAQPDEFEVVESVDANDAVEWVDLGEQAPADTELPVSEPQAQPEMVAAPQPEPEARAPVQDIDDDIDLVDTVDADLFPIFCDEALELLPRLSSALRQWVARAENSSARAEVLRNLHTFKGSARLAGALRLGEMAHRMETAAERLGSDVKLSTEIEPLQADYDALTARFEQLRRGTGLDGVVLHAPEQAPLDSLAAQALEPVLDAPLPESAEPQPALAPEAPLLDAVGQAQPGLQGLTLPQTPLAQQTRAGAAVRVRPELLDRMVNQAGEIMISRSRMELELVTLRGSLKDLTGNLDRLRQQLRDVELQAETQMQSRLARDGEQSFDPLEFDRFTRMQELTRMMAESVNDVAMVQRNLQRAVDATEDSLVAQTRQTRELQRDLLRTRMVEFEGISERLYRVVRQASKETGKQVRLDIVGGHIEMDRGVLDRMTAAFEHLLRNCVVHGIESPEARVAAGKPVEGRIEVALGQERNDVSVTFHDDGAGLDLPRLREKAVARGLLAAGATLSAEEESQLVFLPGLSTADEVTSLAGRGVGMDVVRNDVVALGGRVETSTQAGQGTSFKLVLPLTTAVTQVVMVRAGALTLGVPSTLVEVVRRVSADELARAYARGTLTVGGEEVPFYWAGALLQSSVYSQEAQGRTLPVVIFRSAAQRVAMHVDEVLGNQEVVVKNLGPQLSRLPGLAGMSVLASGAVALIYNPVALATVYGSQSRDWVAAQARRPVQDTPEASLPGETAVSRVPLVLVVDDSITVRRVTQRLLQREGYRVSLAVDGLQALERLQQERPVAVLSDIEMPRMDGFDLLRNIRNDPALVGLPVIMITSRIAEKHREHARELGANHYLGKPYSEDELLALVAHYAQAHVPAPV